MIDYYALLISLKDSKINSRISSCLYSRNLLLAIIIISFPPPISFKFLLQTSRIIRFILLLFTLPPSFFVTTIPNLEFSRPFGLHLIIAGFVSILLPLLYISSNNFFCLILKIFGNLNLFLLISNRLTLLIFFSLYFSFFLKPAFLPGSSFSLKIRDLFSFFSSLVEMCVSRILFSFLNYCNDNLL